MRCICGMESECASATPWLSAAYDSAGRVFRGVCLHGINFDFEELRIDDWVEILGNPAQTVFWAGARGQVKYKAESGEFGIELQTAQYGKITVWEMPKYLKKLAGPADGL